MVTAHRRAACAFGLLALTAAASTGRTQTPAKPVATPEPVVAIAEIRCDDRDLGRIVTEAVETEMMQADRIRVIGSARVRKAAEPLGLVPDSLTDPDDAMKVAAKLGATHLVTGSCFERADRLIVNLRVLQGSDGSALKGGAASAEGPKTDVLPLVKRACADIAKRLSPVSAKAPARSTTPARPSAKPGATATAPTKPAAAEADELTPLRSLGLVPPGARPGSSVTEKQLADLVGKLAKDLGKEYDRSVTVKTPGAPVDRVRVLASLVRLALTAENVEDRKGTLLEGPPDAKNVPPWARPSVEAALDEGWWEEDKPLKPMEPANWSYVSVLLGRMPLVEVPTAANAPIADGTTGLIIDARDLDIQRSSNPKIADEDGQAVYPDPAHLPNMDYLLQHGMAAYSDDEARTPRAGARPLVVKALKTTGPGRDGFVVSRDDADVIRAEDKKSHFLARWAVVVLIKGKAARPVTPPAEPEEK